ncbi:MAG TPA: secretin N-terminal domain-containing protein [Terracidiphilus sp.]|nr:secretin N-terminal domain-containing protein [Terracidiphilus sp.]
MQTLRLMLLFACVGPWLLQASAQPATSSTTKAPKGQNAAEDTNGTFHQMAEEKRRFQTAQQHVGNGLKMRAQGLLSESLIEFQKAYAIDPASPIAAQEIAITLQMIQRERQRVAQTGKEAAPEQRALTPTDEARKKMQDRISRLLPVPELRPLNTAPIHNLKIHSQPVKVLFETLAKLAGACEGCQAINVLWDPEYQAPPHNMFTVDFDDVTLQQALDYAAMLTKSYWKALSPNAIFITNDNLNKRRDYADMVAQTFYLVNVSLPQEIQEIVNAVRSVAELQRVVAFTSQNAIIIRGEADQVALAAKMIHDLDKPRSEVVVDILVLAASSTFSRQITAAVASTGLNVPVNFSPRPGLRAPTNDSSDKTAAMPLANLGRIASSDFSITLPGALLQAALSDAKTKILQSPEVRSVDNVKASLKIGDRQPTATGSFQPGVGGAGVNPLVNTQFNYIDVGVNVDLTPRVHDNGEVSMHVELDISSVSGTVNLGGINEPIISQKKVVHDIRMKEGEVNILCGLTQQQDDKSITGIPGLASIPLIRRLFTGESIGHNRSELMIALIPHIVRRPDVGVDDLRPISVGNATTIKLNYQPERSQQP